MRTLKQHEREEELADGLGVLMDLSFSRSSRVSAVVDEFVGRAMGSNGIAVDNTVTSTCDGQILTKKSRLDLKSERQ